MKTIKITSNNIDSNQICPTSKSYANRVLVSACLIEKEIEIKNLPESQDVVDMINILEVIGIKFVRNSRSLKVLNSFPKCETVTQEIVSLPASEGGTTIRFIIPVLALGQNNYEVNLSGLMSQRPMGNLLENLKNNNVVIKKRENQILIKGPIAKQGDFKIDCEKTTQFASALLHLKLSPEVKFNYELLNVNNSKKYLDLTFEVIKKLKNRNEFTIPPDSSSLGYFLIYGVIRQNLKLLNVLERDAFQADDFIFNVLDDLGVSLFWNDGLLIEKKDKFLKGFSVDGSQCIDLVPSLMLLASFIPFESKIYNVKTLEFKESDRLTEMKNILKHVGVTHSYDPKIDLFKITGRESYPQINNIETVNDHRMIMVSALFLKLLGGGDVSPFIGVKKSFKDFFRIFG